MSHSLRVLLVDDNPDDRALVLRALKKDFTDVQAVEALDAEELRSALAVDRFDIVITDYQLLWSNGLEVLRLAKLRMPDCPVIMFTGTGNEEVAVEAMKEGLDDYILKSPRHYGRLPAAVQTALEVARERARAALLELRLQDLLDRLDVGVCRSRLDGRIAYANPAFLKILALPSDALAQPLYLSSLFPAEGCPSRMEKELLRDGKVRLPEVQARLSDGRSVWLAMTHSIKALRDGECVVETLIEDVTEHRIFEQKLKAKEEQLNQVRKLEAIGRLAGGVAHDFNNLLTAINGYSDLLLDMLNEGGGTKEFLLEIKKAGLRAADLTRELLAFSRRQILRPSLIDVNNRLQRLLPRIHDMAGDSIAVETRFNPDPLTVICDGGQLDSVILKLASNACEAMPGGGRLSLTSRKFRIGTESHPADLSAEAVQLPPGDYAEIEVRDTGKGMSAEMQALIFEPFFSTKTDGKARGAGMGLSAVFGIVKQSGGHIMVESEPDKGSRFRIWLPLDAEKKAGPGFLVDLAVALV